MAQMREMWSCDGHFSYIYASFLAAKVMLDFRRLLGCLP